MYSGVAEIERQEGLGQWADIIAAVAGGLATFGAAYLQYKRQKSLAEEAKKAQAAEEAAAQREAEAQRKAAEEYQQAQAEVVKEMEAAGITTEREKTFIEKYGLYIALGLVGLSVPVTLLIALGGRSRRSR